MADEHDDDEREALDPEVAERRLAALEKIVRIGEPVLRSICRPIDQFDAELHAEIAWMGELMDDALGVGLAAPQVGISHRLFVYRTEPGGTLQCIVNPVLEWAGNETEIAEEGCLSIPNTHVDVERPFRIRIRAQDATGSPIVVDAEGFEARVIQHEMDHLDGVLILDRTTKAQRRAAVRALREAERVS